MNSVCALCPHHCPSFGCLPSHDCPREPDAAAEHTRYFATTLLDADARTIVNVVAVRWEIETLKDHQLNLLQWLQAEFQDGCTPSQLQTRLASRKTARIAGEFLKDAMKKILLSVVFSYLYFLRITCVRAGSLDLACRNTNDYGECWIDANRTNCALVTDTDTGTIDTQNVYCNAGNQGKQCKYANTALTCNHESKNPVQDAVLDASSRNKSSSPQRIKWEIFLEPGEFPITNKDRFFNSGFGRSGIQIPSYTQLSGSLVNDEQKSIIYIPQTVYESIDTSCSTPEKSRGSCIMALLMPTDVVANVVWKRKVDGTLDYRQYDLDLFSATKGKPVNNIIIRDLYLLGVGGVNMLNQNPTADWKARILSIKSAYCTDKHCFYKYTSSFGIKAPYPAGPNIKINHNRSQLFAQAHIQLGWFFNTITQEEAERFVDSNYLDRGVDDDFRANILAAGLPTDPIEITDNTMYGSLGGSTISLWGSYVDILRNNISGGFGDWVGNQIAITPGADSSNINIASNNIDSYITGINLEDILSPPNSGSDWMAGFSLMYQSSRVSRNNNVVNNRMTNVLNCLSVQRQINYRASGNTCSLDIQKADRLLDINYYTRERYAFLEDFLKKTLTPLKALQTNGGLIGTGILVRSSQGSVFDNNTFTNIPRPIDLRSLKLLPGGMKDNRFSRNFFNISRDTLSHYRSYAVIQGLPDTYRNFYWPAGDLESSNNLYCSNNQSDFPVDLRFDIAPINQLSINVNCPNPPSPTPHPYNYSLSFSFTYNLPPLAYARGKPTTYHHQVNP